MTPIDELLAEVRACRVCAERLPEGSRPIVRAGSSARIVIIGQAPGRRVHRSGVPWDDPSGETLRGWLGVTTEQFYNPGVVALGAYAQKRYIADRAETLTATVANWRNYLPGRIVMPHPSPRNRNWLTKNLWFESETLPAVRRRIAEVVSAPRT